MDYQQAFYLCKAEAEQRNRDINMAIERVKKGLDFNSSNYDLGEIIDGLASISHHSEMTIFSFTKCEKEMEQKDDGLSILDSMAKLKSDCEKLVKETR